MMKYLIASACALALFAPAISTPSAAHVMEWRPGESRQVGYRHCAKGPCAKRTCWAPTKPHRHVAGKIIIDPIGPPECWKRQ